MDIVVAAGFGNIADAFSDLARDEVLMFRASARLGKPFVLFSQGLGPVEDQHFLRILSRVLPKADLIAVREAGGSLRLAQQLGVPEDRITVTGDDALEVAYGAPRGRSATRIGVNIRVTDYAGVDIEVSRRIGSIIAEVASDLSVPCIGLPIRLASDGPGHLDDAEALRKMFDSSPEVCPTSSPVATPSGLASLVSDCRLVVAGSYHAAVFALGQGVPAIGLFKSRYYGEKFGGLKSQFKAGCYLVDLNDHDWEISLRSTIVTVYKKAERLRPILRARAVSQIAASRNAYSRLATLLPQGVGRV